MHERRRALLAASERLYIIERGTLNTDNAITVARSDGVTDEQNRRYVPSTANVANMGSFGIDVTEYKRAVVDWGAQNRNNDNEAHSQVLMLFIGEGSGAEYSKEITRGLSQGESGFNHEIKYLDISEYSGKKYIKFYIGDYTNEYYSFVNSLYLEK